MLTTRPADEPAMGQRAADQTNRPTVRTFTVEAVELPVGDVRPVSGAWTVAVVAGVFAAVLVFWGRVLYSDAYTDLSAGRLIARSGLPSHDSLTVAANGGRWIDEQWLAHLIYYGAWRVGGYALMGATSALLVAAAFGLLFRLMVRRGATPVFAFGCAGLAFAVSDLNLETRPQSFSYPLFVLLLTLLCAEQRSPRFGRRLLLAWPLLVLWGNLHGSVLLGIAACGAFAFVRGASAARSGDAAEVARYLGWLAVAVMSAVVTPYGTGILGYYPSVLGNPNLRYIGEWQHASLGGPSVPFLVLLLGTACYAAFGWRRGVRPDPFLACLAAALTLMGLQAIRYQVWFALIAALLVSDLSTRVGRRTAPIAQTSRYLPHFAAAVACFGALVAATITATTPAQIFEAETPPAALRATAQAAQTTHGAILTDDLTGSALPWLYPQLAGRVAFDSRTEIFPAKPFQQLVRFLTLSPRWQAALNGYDEISVTCLMGHPKLCQTVPQLPGWRVVYATDSAVVSVRQ
jgi:hypothetical protein